MIEVLLLAIILSLDIFIVAFSQGLIFTENKLKNSLKLAIAVGIFHFVMLFIGGVCGFGISRVADELSHFVVLFIFLILGIKFIKDAFKDKEARVCIGNLCFTNIVLIALATSFDALGVGISIYFTSVGILKSSLIVGFTAFLFSNIGFTIGNFFKKLPTKFLEITAGIILIFLGVKNVLEHYLI